jgi:hypothetical protein
VLLVCLTAVVTLAPFTVEAIGDACDVNYNGSYNRFGAALLLTVFVAALIPARFRLAEALTLAWMLSILLLFKVTFALAALAFVTIAALFSAERRRALLGALILMIVATLALEVTTGLPAAYLRDIGVMARVGGGDMTARLWRAIATYPLALSLAGALIAVLAWQGRELARRVGHTTWPERLHAIEIPILGAACVALTLWAESQSTGGAG